MRALAIASLLALGCGGATAPPDLAAQSPDFGPFICPANVDDDIAPVCTVLGQHCVTPTGAYPYFADCRGCGAGPYYWYVDAVGIVCPDGGAD